MTQQPHDAYADLAPSVGDRLRIARERRAKLSQGDFADLVNASRGTVSNYERDNLPRLVVGHTVFTKAGLSVEQFLLLVQSTIAATHELVAECERSGFLNLAEIQVAPESVH